MKIAAASLLAIVALSSDARAAGGLACPSSASVIWDEPMTKVDEGPAKIAGGVIRHRMVDGKELVQFVPDAPDNRDWKCYVAGK